MPPTLAEEGQGHMPLAPELAKHHLDPKEEVHKLFIHNNTHLGAGMRANVSLDHQNYDSR